MAYPYNYGGYPATGGYYAPPMPDNLAQLRQGNTYQPQMQNVQPVQPVQPVQTTTPTPTQPTSNGILWVQGEEGAKAWLVAPGSTVMLMDSDGGSFYLKSADASGMPLPLRIFDYTERISAPKTPVDNVSALGVEYVTRQEFDALAAKFEAITGKETAKPKKTTKETTENE